MGVRVGERLDSAFHPWFPYISAFNFCFISYIEFHLLSQYFELISLDKYGAKTIACTALLRLSANLLYIIAIPSMAFLYSIDSGANFNVEFIPSPQMLGTIHHILDRLLGSVRDQDKLGCFYKIMWQ